MTKNNSPDDKTRIAPSKLTDDPLAAQDETVIKQATDRTRVTPATQQRLDKQPDETVVKSDQATRIAPSKSKAATEAVSKNPDHLDSHNPSGLDNGSEEERIIKNRFVIKESLGAGGMAMVFRALDLRKQETGDSEPYIAIKILGRELEDHPQAFVTLQREAKKSQILSHPNVIKVFDFDRDGDLVFLTMEELKGRPLNKLLKEYADGLPLEIAIPIIQSISDGLAYAHKKNIVHADLKLENIFYTDDGEVKIIDFGIARIITDLDKQERSSAIYNPDEVVGLTPAYASLEMLRDEAPIPSDDVYALGIISYELLTGSHPYKRKPADIAFEERLSFKKIPQLKGYQWKAIAKALSFEHQDRLKNGEEFRNLFVGRGRAIRNLTIGLVAISLVLLVSLLIPREGSMDHLYDELPPQQQAKFDELMLQGNTLLDFNDWNNALTMFEQAYEILPQHSQTKASLDKAVLMIIDTIEDNSSNLTHQEKLEQVNQLSRYKSLIDNEHLENYKNKLMDN